MGDTGFELAARTAVGMVEQLNPEFRGRHVVEVTSPYRVRGRHFTTLVHILFFLVENALHHSDVSRESFQSKLTISGEKGDIELCVHSPMTSPACASVAAQTIMQILLELKAKLEPAKVVKEGGSGFAKIIAALLYEFKQIVPVVTATSKDCNVLVTVTCDVGALAA